MSMSERAPAPLQAMPSSNRGEQRDQIALSLAEELPGQAMAGDPGPADQLRDGGGGGDRNGRHRPHGDAGAPAAGQAQADTAHPGQAGSSSGQAHPEERDPPIATAAQIQGELLRVRAEEVRAEAECLRAEATALRTAIRGEVEAARSSAEAAAQAHAAVAELQIALLAEADAVRVEFDRTRTEAMSIRRLLREETEAGFADARRVRAEVQNLWAETDKLGLGLRLLFARGGIVGALQDGGDETTSCSEHGDRSAGGRAAEEPHRAVRHGRTGTQIRGLGDGAPGHAEDLRPPIVSQASAPAPPGAPPEAQNRAVATTADGPSPDATEAEMDTGHGRTGPRVDKNVAELLKDIWDAISADSRPPSTGEQPMGEAAWPQPDESWTAVDAPFDHEADDRHVDQPRASQALIGSGGWRVEERTAPGDGSVAPEAGPGRPSHPPAGPGRRRRRFGSE